MILIWSAISLALFFFFFAFLPGHFLLKRAIKSSSWDQSLIIGIALLGLVLLLGRWFLPTTWLLAFYLTAIILITKPWQLKLSLRVKKITVNWWLLLVLLLGVSTQAMPFIQSMVRGRPYLDQDVYSNHDQSWHASLIFEFTNHYPPQVPGLSGVTLKNYNYSYDLIVAANLQMFGGDINYLIQALYPVLISLFYGISLYRLAAHLSQSKFTQIAAVFFGYFLSNLNFLLYFFDFTNWQIRDLILDQPIIFLFNQQTVLSISFIIYHLLLTYKILKNRSLLLPIILGLSFTSHLYLKVFGFVTHGLALAVFAFVILLTHFRKKTFKPIFTRFSLLFFAAALSLLPLLIFNLDLKGGLLVFKPGWLADIFFERVLSKILPQLVVLKMSWQFRNQPLKLTLLTFFSTIILILVNYHFRLLSLYFAWQKKFTLEKLFLLVSVISLLFTLSGYQKSSAFNIIQYAPYATVLTTVLSLKVLEKTKPFLKYFSLVLMFLISFFGSYKAIYAFSRDQSLLLDEHKVKLLQLLQDKPEAVVVSFIEDDMRLGRIYNQTQSLSGLGNNLIGAIGHKPAFYADRKQLAVLDLNYEDRLSVIETLRENFCDFKPIHQQIIEANHLTYFLVPRKYQDCFSPSVVRLELLGEAGDLSLFAYEN